MRFHRVVHCLACLLFSTCLSHAQFWQVDPSFKPPVIEDVYAGGAGYITPLSDGGVLLVSPAPFINGQLVGKLVRVSRSGAVETLDLPLDVASLQILAVYPDGKLLTALIRDGGNSSVARLNTNGTIDSSFIEVKVYHGGRLGAGIQSDGKVLVWGSRSPFPGGEMIRRFTATGQADATFAAPTGEIHHVADAAVQADGKIVLVGKFLATRANVIRLSATGALDSSFTSAVTGEEPESWEYPQLTNWVQIQADGTILVGNFRPNRLVRLKADGSRDASFTPAIPKGSDRVGKPVLGGKIYFTQVDTVQSLKRLNADGTLDASFTMSGAYGQAWSVNVPETADGTTLYFGPVTMERYVAKLSLTQTDSAGVINPSFSLRFAVSSTPVSFERYPNGKYLFSAWTNHINSTAVPTNSVYRLNSDGSIDSMFTPQLPEDLDNVEHLSALPDGGGVYIQGGKLIRTNPNGSVASSVNLPGELPALTPNGDLYSMHLLAPGSGEWRRHRADGTQDLTFKTTASIHEGQLKSTSDGGLYVVSASGPDTLMRLAATGAQDTTFAPILVSHFFGTIAVLPDDTPVEISLGSHRGGGIYSAKFTRYDRSGAPTYQYEGSTEPLIVAGVLFDLIRAVSPSGGSARVEIPQPRKLIVHVTSKGEATVCMPGTYPVQRYKRTTLTSPSVPDGGAFQAPKINQQPQDVTVAEGSEVVFTVSSSNPVTDYRWDLKRAGTSTWDVPVQSDDYVGVLGPQLTIKNATKAMNGDMFRCRLYNAAGGTASVAVTLTVTSGSTDPGPTPNPEPPPPPAAAAKLSNISTRSLVGVDDKIQIAGLVIRGTEAKRVIIRAVGPGLTKLDVPGVLEDPVLTLYADGKVLMTNDDWSADATAAAQAESAGAEVGAFGLTRGSKDAVIVTTLAPGRYTAQVTGKGGKTGVALIEAYEVPSTPSASKLINISTRSETRSGGEIQIAGFVVSGSQPKRVLIRASGTSLVPLGVATASVLEDPVLGLFSGRTKTHENDDWSADAATAAEIETIARDVGAFAVARGSKDAALLVTLAPGAYTAQVTGKAGKSGITLVEVYEAP